MSTGLPRELCDACAELPCKECGHEACPICIDTCDHAHCIEWDDRGHGRMNHACVFPPCPNGCDRAAIAKNVREHGAP